MQKNLQTKFLLLLTMIFMGVGQLWAEDVQVASATFNGKGETYTTGWSTTGTGKGRSDCIIIGQDENITSPSFDLSQYSNVTISIKARRYGSLSDSKATIDVSISGTSVGSVDATSTSATTSLTAIEFTPTSGMTAATLVFTCTNATSAGSTHGAGINSIVITGTPKSDTPPTSPLSSITVDDSDATTTFHVGDTFTSEGVVVTATYEDESTKDVTDDATFSGYDMATTGSQTVTVSYTEGGVTKTDTYGIQINPLPNLSSITLSGDYPIQFNQNGTFSYEGLVVTANYDDNTSKEVTDFTVSEPDLTTTGEKNVTVSYTEGDITKSAEYTITVNEYTQPTEVEIELNNTFFGTTYNGSFTSQEKTDLKNAGGCLEGSENNVKVTYDISNSSNAYINDEQIRVYSNLDLIVTAPSGYNITSIEFVEPSSGKAWAGTHTSNPDGYDGDYKTWTGSASEVTITFGGTCRIAGINVTLEAAAPQTVTATIAAACTDGTNYFSTFSCTSAFVVPEDVIVSEIAVTDGKFNVQAYATGAIVPANTGVMISSATAGEKVFTLSSEDGTSVLGDDNALRATGDEGITPEQMAAADESCLYYRLTMHNGTQIGFWWGAANGAAFNVAANKAYLAVPNANAARMENFWFADGIITAINSVNVEKGTLNSDAPMYNLAGQRVSKSYKGVVIQNGKKYIVK